MEPPKNIEIFDSPTSMYWFDENNVLCSILKKSASPTLQETKDSIEILKKKLNGEKVCMLIDATYSSETTKEMREFAAIEFTKIIKAMAIISKSPLGIMLANIFFRIKKQPYPAKIFSDEKKAKEWLTQFINIPEKQYLEK
jgi:hypothetical protein